jgi:predicted MFS family arabinose efflux permease
MVQHPAPLSGYQKFVVALLAFLQFTILLDFMILSPLSALLMPAMKITPQQFGWVVSTYAFSAGASGLLAAGFADRFDRKRLLLFFYCGFVLGTLLCAVATSYHFLLFARMITGLFGGVIGSIVFAITTDLFPFEMRGRVMGVVQTAFAAAQVLGIPLGLYISNHWGWNAPFLMIVGVSTCAGAIIVIYLKPIDAHLKKRPDRSPIHHLIHTVSTPRYLQGFATTALLSTGGFMLMPFASAFSVNNLNISIDKLPFIYMVTGITSIIAGPIVGRLSDRLGKYRMFVTGCAITIIMVIIYTNLKSAPIGLFILISAILYIGVSTRMIAASALVSAIPQPTDRGSYMSISSSIQQVSGGLASVVAGLLVAQESSGRLLHFNWIGNVVVCTTLITATLMYFIDRMIKGDKPLVAPQAPHSMPMES